MKRYVILYKNHSTVGYFKNVTTTSSSLTSSQGDWIVREEKKEIPVLKTLKGVRLPSYFCNLPFPLGACVKGI